MRPTWASLGQTVAVSVATILGTGILGLPVSLYASGTRPFLLLFTANLVAQIGVVFATTELLQRVFLTPARTEYEAVALSDLSTSASQPKSEYRGTDVGSDDDDDDIDAPLNRENGSETHHSPPSLHSLATHFIHSPTLRVIFNTLVLGHFIFILCVYTLAAPQAYVALFPVLGELPVYVQSTAFLITMSVIVYTLTPGILPSLSVATFVKAVLLTLLVILTLARGLTVRREVESDWRLHTLIDPFLMGTIALSGVVNLMPVTFQTCVNSLGRDDRRRRNSNSAIPIFVDGAFVSAYRSATVAALVLCFLLNVAWAYAVLLVVPQSSSSTPLPPSSPLANAAPNATLENAQALGQISTIPLMQVLQASHDRLNAVVALLVNSFIAISMTISFLVMSVGLLHFVKGSIPQRQMHFSHPVKKMFNSLFLRYWSGFIIVLIIALLNPTGLLKIMEGITTLALNLEAGAFVVYMFYTCRISSDTMLSSFSGLLSSSQAAAIIAYLIVYFSAAVFVDVFFYLPLTLFGDSK